MDSRRVEEILIIYCYLPIVVFGRAHRLAPTNNLISRSLALLSFLPINKSGVNSNRNLKTGCLLEFIPEKSGTGMTFLVYNRFFYLSFLPLNKSGVNYNRNLKTGCLLEFIPEKSGTGMTFLVYNRFF